ncbi:hypothetical protein [Antribacter gilvus]|uniref:hypothetical protein n=1 Tax=Antribacter gilvus TaxID=2304675 RepID=UPI000F79593E|nr:hypothetical protein [Antribacter gilvus]
MRRLFWVGVGVAVTVVVYRQGRRLVARYTPEAVSDRAAAVVDDAGARVSQFARQFRAEFTVARAERERELRAALLADGQPDPEVTRARRAAAYADEHRRRADVPDDEAELGYSFY